MTGFKSQAEAGMATAVPAASASGAKAGKSWTASFQKSGVTKAAGKLSEGLLGVAAGSVYAAVKFQSAMEKIHTQAGVAQKDIKGLGNGVLKLAGQVGISPDSLAESLYHVESAFSSLGISGPKALKLVKIAAEGAAVGGADLVDVTNALTAFEASGIKGARDMSKAMGIMNAIVGAGDMKMSDLADAFGTGLLASIKGFGVSIQDAGAALAVFGDNNIRGAKAGTQLRMAIQALAAPTGAGKKILEGWGLSAATLAKDMQKGGLKLALEDLQSQFRKFGISTKQQGQYLTELFGKRAGVGVQILLGQMDRFESKFPALAKGAGSFGDAWKKTQATASQQFKDLTQGLVAVGVKIGTKLLPPLMAVFGFVRAHTGLVLTLAGIIGGLAVAITAVSFAIRLYEAALAIATAAQWLFDAATSANPLGATIILIGLMVTAIVLLWKHCSWFRTAVLAVWDAVKTAFDAVWGALKTAFAWVVDHWKLLAAIIFGPIGLAVDAIVTHWKFVTRVFAVFWSWLKFQWQVVYDYIIKPIGQAAAFIFNTWKSILTGVAQMIIKIKNFFAPAVTWLVDAGKKIIEGLFGGMWHAVQAAWTWVSKIGGTILHAVIKFFGIKSPSTVFFGMGTNLMKGLFQGMVHGAAGLAGWVVKEIEHIGGSILGGLLGLLGFSGGGGSTSGSPGKPVGTYQNYAASILGSFGWAPREMSALIPLWNGESGWNPNAQNPTSTAYGIAQFLDTTWAGYRYPKTSDGYKQVFDGLQYIKGRYGSPTAAYSAWLSRSPHWYGDGTSWAQPGWAVVGERGPELMRLRGGEQVIPSGRRFGRGGRITEPVAGIDRRGRSYLFGEAGGETVIPDSGLARIEALLEMLIGAVRQNSGDTAHGVAMALGGAAHTAAMRAEWSPR